MTCKYPSRFRIFAAAAIAAMRIASAQNVVATSGSRNINLAPNPAMVTFVATKANTVESAAKDAVLSTAQSQVISTALRAVPIPIVGPMAGPLMKMALNKFHPPTTTGFNIAFVQGLSAKTAVPLGDLSLRVPASSLKGATPTLLRINPSAKDSTRIVRSLRLSVKVNGSSFTPTAENTKLILVAENVISCRLEQRNGDAILIPDAPLEEGEYAVALVPASQDNMVPVGLVWDFRVSGSAPQPPEAARTKATGAQEPALITLGQTPAEITASLGNPQRIAKLGAKEIYYYRDLKVVFVNNKVAEVI
jgi:hypothetical protein